MRWSFSKLHAHVVVSRGVHRLAGAVLPDFEWRVIPNGIDERHFTPDGRADRRAARGRQAGDPVPRPLRSPATGSARCCARSSACTASTRANVAAVRGRRRPAPRVLPAPARPARRPRRRLGRSRRLVAPALLRVADVHCTPCNRASFGMVLLEAMSCGRPGAREPHLGFQLVMEHGRQGLLVSPADDADRFARRPAVPARPPGRARAHGARGPRARRSRATRGATSPASSRRSTRS